MEPRGEPDEFEIIWKTGHIDRVKAHQVSYPNNARNMFTYGASEAAPNRIAFHAEVNGRWTLMLSMNEDELLSVRNMTQLNEQP